MGARAGQKAVKRSRFADPKPRIDAKGLRASAPRLNVPIESDSASERAGPHGSACGWLPASGDCGGRLFRDRQTFVPRLR